MKCHRSSLGRSEEDQPLAENPDKHLAQGRGQELDQRTSQEQNCRLAHEGMGVEVGNDIQQLTNGSVSKEADSGLASPATSQDLEIWQENVAHKSKSLKAAGVLKYLVSLLFGVIVFLQQTKIFMGQKASLKEKK